MIHLICPDCQKPINLESLPKIGQQVLCQACNVDLVVTWLFPIRLDLSEKIEQPPVRTDMEID